MANLEENRPGWMREKMGFDALFAYGMGLLTFSKMTQALSINDAAADALTKLAAASEQAGARAAAAAANYPLAAGALFKQLATTVLPLTLVLIAIGFIPLALVKWTPELFATKDASEPEPTPPNGQESGEMSDAYEVRASKDSWTRLMQIMQTEEKPATATGTDETGIDEKGASEK